MVYKIIVDDRKVNAWLRKIPKNIRKRGQQGMNQFGQTMVQELLLQAQRAGINQFRQNRSMFTNTKYVQKKNYGYLSMPKSGLYQDRAKPHYVTITRKKPLLWAWARQKGFEGRGFMFTPKPFIRQGIRNSTRRLMPIMRPQMHLAISESH